ncbi:hypothetical protein RchiOBHm_Chr5g0016961 [Rosa chinensis]|uniref:Uncharacterized protein n=1 Tax=Rosa chinensis TaxID=74649 RepID=A0A2P6Q6D4_ROSCH|nr:hypothetical protein RchiOBHm_Chr5g0016961 [Rosa chinensis]
MIYKYRFIRVTTFDLVDRIRNENQIGWIFYNHHKTLQSLHRAVGFSEFIFHFMVALE